MDINKILNGKVAKSSGKEPMKDNPESRQAQGKNASENSDIAKKVKPTTTRPGTDEGNIQQGFDIVNKVERVFAADSPEAARKKNNMARDLRSNLGRGTWSVPIAE